MELPAHFEELMNRSPFSQADIASFLREMRRTPSGTLVTSKLLSAKIQSASEAQAIHAFDVLEACLSSETEGSIEFRTEIGRYRFLNEIIRILSPKYMGDGTQPGVKERAVKFLEDAAGPKRKQWFPSEHSKIQAVYQSLVDGGVIKKNPKFPSTEADEEAELQKSIFDRQENASILKKLLQSRDPSDLQAANRLIKNLVEEESRRIERRAELHSLIDRIETSTSLLVEMLSQSKVDKEIVEELADTCLSLRQRLGGVATETNDETTSLLNASENLEQALEFYGRRKSMDFEEENQDESSGASGVEESKPIRILSLTDELLLSLDLGTTQDDPPGQKSNSGNSLSNTDNLVNLDIELSSNSSCGGGGGTSQSQSDSKTKVDPLDSVRVLSEQLQQSLMGSSNRTNDFKKSDKTPLSQIPKSSSNESVSQKDKVSLLDLDFGMLDLSPMSAGQNSVSVASNPQNCQGQPNSENSLLLDFTNSQNDGQQIINSKTNVSIKKSSTSTISIAPENPTNPTNSPNDLLKIRQLLNSIKSLDLDKVDLIPGLKPMELDLTLDTEEDSCIKDLDISLTLTFATANEELKFPDNLKVGIVTFINKSKTSHLNNYVFQLIPPKGYQVKLLPPTGMELPPWKKSFLPPPVLNQVALLLIPQPLSTLSQNKDCRPKMKYILSYTSDDDTALHNGHFEIPHFL